MNCWHILTSKYPPAAGGIGHHSAHLAYGLRKRNFEVHVWTTVLGKEEPLNKNSYNNDGLKTTYVDEDGVTVHRLVTSWNTENFDHLAELISEKGGTLLIQYKPTIFGGYWNSALDGFVGKLKSSGRLQAINLIIHEPFAIPQASILRPRTWLAPAYQYVLLRNLLKNSDNTYVTTNNWKRFLKPFKLRENLVTLPVPSNIRNVAERQFSLNLRKAFASDAKMIIGTYSSFKEYEMLEILDAVISKTLTANPDWVWLLLGRQADKYCERLVQKYPAIADQIQTAGELDQNALSAHLQVADMMVQPYFQGVNTRRTSTMAALFHAMPVITSTGQKTESIWWETRCVRLVDWKEPSQYLEAIRTLSANENQRLQLSHAARLTYESCFSLEQNLRLLTSV